MNIYAFDVDHTLWLSRGPVRLGQLLTLYGDGHILGICGNWARVVALLPNWHRLFSFIGPMEMTKPAFLKQLMDYIHAEHYFVVGNDGDGKVVSADKSAALAADWEFILAEDFDVKELCNANP